MRRTWLVLCLLALVSLLGGALPAARPDRAEGAVDEDYRILLLTGEFVPAPGIRPGDREALQSRAQAVRNANGSVVHTILQLTTIPTDEEKDQLASQGIFLQHYVPHYAWIAAISAVDPVAVLAVPGVRWVGDWSAQDKLHPYIQADLWDQWAIHPSENMVMVIVQLHSDVPLERGAALAQAHGGVALPPISGIHGMTVWIPKETLLSLAAEEEVLWIEQGPPPLSPNNDGVRSAMHVDEVQAAPYNLDGSGVRIFVFDGGTVRTTHNTFNPGSRVTMIDDVADVQDHPTHVAGTAAGDGDNGRAKGVAPAATVLSAEYEQTGGTMLFWDNAGDIQADYANARNNYNADLGTNSIGSNTASNNYNCAREGDYGVSSNMLDGIVRGDNPTVGSAVLMTWANGNERTGGTSYPGRCGSNYLTTAPPSCAKNPIHVGATNSDYNSMTTFSSWGPCDDGRLEPVVSGPGCELGRASGESYIYSSLATNNNSWGGSGWCGTSMSTPATAGVVALMIQDWRAQGYGGANDRPLPALVKAMLIHTARDLGQKGPDYIYGYGEVDAKAAIDLIRAGGPLGTLGDGRPDNFGTTSISQGQTRTYNVNVPAGMGELKVSLAWDDYAAAAFSAYAPVNDLNLEVVSPGGTTYYPWTLNASAPYQPAGTGVNALDNQEQVVVNNPTAGAWTIRVVGSTVPQGPQTYALVYTTRPPTYDAAACTEQIVNGTFEIDTSSWTLSGATRVAAPAGGHGSWSLRLGGATSSSHTAYQQVSIPAETPRAEFSFWWYMTTQEGSSGHPWDYFYAEVRNTSGTVLGTVDYRSDGWQTSQWMKSENLDLTPWAGQTVRIYFYATNDSVLYTSFYVDDVSLQTCAAPTAVKLTSFAARPAAGGILLAWETASEHDNAGFNLYRSLAVGDRGVQLNEALLPSRSPGGDQGASYEFLDAAAMPGVTYSYTLEDVDLAGQRTPHGPVVGALWRVYLPVVGR